MSGIYAPPCVCPADKCFGAAGNIRCKHYGKVLARFVDKWGGRFAAYIAPGEYRPGQRTPTGARCTGIALRGAERRESGPSSVDATLTTARER